MKGICHNFVFSWLRFQILISFRWYLFLFPSNSCINCFKYQTNPPLLRQGSQVTLSHWTECGLLFYISTSLPWRQICRFSEYNPVWKISKVISFRKNGWLIAYPTQCSIIITELVNPPGRWWYQCYFCIVLWLQVTFYVSMCRSCIQAHLQITTGVSNWAGIYKCETHWPNAFIFFLNLLGCNVEAL